MGLGKAPEFTGFSGSGDSSGTTDTTDITGFLAYEGDETPRLPLAGGNVSLEP
jgi:hypothetical protein